MNISQQQYDRALAEVKDFRRAAESGTLGDYSESGFLAMILLHLTDEKPYNRIDTLDDLIKIARKSHQVMTNIENRQYILAVRDLRNLTRDTHYTDNSALSNTNSKTISLRTYRDAVYKIAGVDVP